MKNCALILLLVLLFPASASAQKSRVVVDEHQVSTWLTDNMSAMQLPSVAAGIVGPDKNYYLQIYGKPELHQPYLIGSLSKSVTAMATMLLVHDGKLSLDDPASKWVDTVPEDVTVRDLLHQTSGLDRRDGWYPVGTPIEDRARDATWNAPRNAFSYSNLNYQVLGAIVERVSDMSYGDFVHERIFEPLGMRQSHARSGHADNRVVGHQFMYGFPMRTGEPDYAPETIPSGFVWMSANDMATWLRVHLTAGKLDGKQVIPAAVIEPMLDAPSTRYAMGWLKSANAEYDTAVFSHSGATSAFTSAMAIAPEREVGVFVFTNVNSFLAMAPTKIMGGMLGSVLGSSQASTSNLEFIGRLIFGAIVALILLTFIFETLRWIREGFPFRLVPKERNAVILTFVINGAVLVGIVVYFQISFSALIENQPDIGWGALFLTIGGSIRRLISGFVKSKSILVLDET